MPRDLTQRSYELEIMDADIESFAAFDESLSQIEKVNSLTLGYRPVLSWLEKQFAAPQPVSILDVGHGRGALLREIRKLTRREKIPAMLTGIDISPWAEAAARMATPGALNIEYRTGNVFRSGDEADFVVCSHVTHHMTDSEAVAFIGWLEKHARQGWFICDLERSTLAYLCAKVMLFFAPVNAMVRNDGAVSVARAFTRRDWQRLLNAAGVAAEIRWYFPFRLCVARKKP